MLHKQPRDIWIINDWYEYNKIINLPWPIYASVNITLHEACVNELEVFKILCKLLK